MPISSRSRTRARLIAQNQLTRSATTLRYKLDDLPSNADDSELQAIQFGAKKVIDQFQAVTALANTFVINSDKAVAASAMARLKFVENSLQAISSKDEKIVQGLKEASALLEEYRQALTKLIENSKEIDELTAEMTDSAAAIDKGSGAMKSDLRDRSEAARGRVACDHRRDRAADPDAGRRRLPARRRLGVPARHRNLAADDRDVQGDA